MKNRLQQFLESEGLSQAQFADSINVARAGISHIMSGRNNPSYEFIVNTIRRYPDLNIEWLLTGNGTMYGKSARVENSSSPAFYDTNSEISETAASMPATAPKQTEVSPRQISKVIVLYSDGSYTVQE